MISELCEGGKSCEEIAWLWSLWVCRWGRRLGSDKRWSSRLLSIETLWEMVASRAFRN